MNLWVLIILVVGGLWIVMEIIGRFFPESFKNVIIDFFRFLFKGE